MKVKAPKEISIEGGSIVAIAAFIAMAMITWNRGGWLFAIALIVLFASVLLATYAVGLVNAPRNRNHPGLRKPTKMIATAWKILAGGFVTGLLHVLISAVTG